MEKSKAFYEVYEGSIYMHQGKTYLIDHVDLETKVARCHDVTVRYYTKVSADVLDAKFRSSIVSSNII